MEEWLWRRSATHNHARPFYLQARAWIAPLRHFHRPCCMVSMRICPCPRLAAVGCRVHWHLHRQRRHRRHRWPPLLSPPPPPPPPPHAPTRLCRSRRAPHPHPLPTPPCQAVAWSRRWLWRRRRRSRRSRCTCASCCQECTSDLHKLVADLRIRVHVAVDLSSSSSTIGLVHYYGPMLLRLVVSFYPWMHAMRASSNLADMLKLCRTSTAESRCLATRPG